MKSHVKVAVIGGGVVGASVLYHLTKKGWRDVALIERSELTSGSTWHAAGGMHTLNGDPNVAQLQQYTISLYKEIEAAQNTDRRAGMEAFDAAFCGHVSFMLRNMAGSFLHAISLGRFASTPVSHEMARWYRQLARYTQSFALVGDWTVAFLGGDLKRRGPASP